MIHAAVVGLGWWGKTIVSMLRSSRKMRVTAIVEPHAEAATPFCREAGLALHQELDLALADPTLEAVILTSPHRFHEEQIHAAARAGKHVFCEKPLALSLASAAAAVSSCLRHGVRLGIGHERRFEPPMRELRRLMTDGSLGRLLAIEGNFSHDKFLALAPDNWRLSRAEAACGPMTATGIHLLDMAVSLGGAATSVHATNRTLATAFESGDSLSAHVALAGGAVATINALLATPFHSRFVAFGTQGWMEIRDRSHVEAPTGWTVLRSSTSGEPEVTQWPAATPVLDNLESFADSITGSQADYAVPLQDMLDTVAAFDAVHRSTLSEQTVVPERVLVSDL